MMTHAEAAAAAKTSIPSGLQQQEDLFHTHQYFHFYISEKSRYHLKPPV